MFLKRNVRDPALLSEDARAPRRWLPRMLTAAAGRFRRRRGSCPSRWPGLGDGKLDVPGSLSPRIDGDDPVDAGVTLAAPCLEGAESTT